MRFANMIKATAQNLARDLACLFNCADTQQAFAAVERRIQIHHVGGHQFVGRKDRRSRQLFDVIRVGRIAD